MRRRIFIDGEAGTTGLGIRARLEAIPDIALCHVPPEHYKNPEARAAAMRAAELVVLCLPDAAAREAVAIVDSLGPERPKILDASTAHRTAPGWVYGFPELSPGQEALIAKAERVANPGCYATGAIALLHPLIAAGLLPPSHPLCISAVSGYSGAGAA